MNDNLRLQLQDFHAKLNKEPEVSELEQTPDKRAKTLPISFVEMTLDELFLGQWGTLNFTSKVISNEVCGELTLWVVHPITAQRIERVGAAAIIITVDKAPEELHGKDRNAWAIDVLNKKPNTLDLGYPKLKSECLKNAAQSLGKVFGRDLNRKKADKYQPSLKTLSDIGFKALIKRIESGDQHAKALAESNFILDDIQKSILEGTTIKQLNGN